MKRWLQKGSLTTIFALTALLLSGCGKPFLSALTPAGEVGRKTI